MNIKECLNSIKSNHRSYGLFASDPGRNRHLFALSGLQLIDKYRKQFEW